MIQGLPLELDNVCTSIAHLSFRPGGPYTRDDLIQIAREAALLALKRHDGRERGLKGFIANVCRWRIADAYRKAMHEPRPAVVDGSVEREAAEAEAEEPHDALERLEGLRQARMMLDAVPSSQRRVLVLAFLYERSYAEIAEDLGITPGAAKQLRNRGLANLRRLAA
jgi:RNA polymerase sigma factor (sigma-70 family)